jgi:3,8-divinyl chlorophyllide a/chlorophyllide a reductase subunit Y
MMLEPMGLAPGPVVPTREWRELYGALDCRSPRPSIRNTPRAAASLAWPGRPVVGSAPVGCEGTASWLDAIGAACGIAQDKVDLAKNRILPAIAGALSGSPIKGRMTVSGYEGSELLVARLLIESGADVPYVGTACGRTPWSEADLAWLESRGVPVQFRASLEQDIAAVKALEPDLAIGTTPVVQAAKEMSIPALYFTNLISARPLMGPAGAGSSGPGHQYGAGQSAPIHRDARLLRRRRGGRDLRDLGSAAGPAVACRAPSPPRQAAMSPVTRTFHPC